MKWQELAATSHYQTAVAVEEALQRGSVSDAKAGIQELVDALARSEKRALKSQLIRLMAHVIKWLTQPDRRTRSWSQSIRNARDEIAEIQEDTPSLTPEVIEEMWESSFARAKADAEDDMNQTSPVAKLTWRDVFETEYKVESP
jgi:transcriptional accessory protein Tex/SPT6